MEPSSLPGERGTVAHGPSTSQMVSNERKQQSADNDSFKLCSISVLRAPWPSLINNKIYKLTNKDNKEAEEHKYGKQGEPLGSTKSGWASWGGGAAWSGPLLQLEDAKVGAAMAVVHYR